MRFRRKAAGAVATAAFTLALGGTASADIYWAAEGADTIGRANNEGGGVQTGFIGGPGVATDPTGVAINGTHIYWSHAAGTGGSIGRDTIGGSGSPTSTLIPTDGDPQGVSLDAANVYWTHASGTPTPSGWVGRGTLNGFVPLFFGQQFQPTANTSQCGVAANGDRAFWTNPGAPGSIGSAHGVDPPDQNYIPGGANDPCGVAMTTGLVYWTNRGGESGTIGRATLTGTEVDTDLVDTDTDTGTGSDPCGVAVTGEHIYWSDPVSDVIGRADLDGSDVDPDFINLASGTDPCGMAVSPTQAATPGSYDFGAVGVGSETDVAAFSIANTASSVLDVTSVTLMGPDAGQFKLTGEGCSPAMTSPGLNCFVNAGYNPTAEGSHTAFLQVVSNASNSPTDIQLSGTAAAPPSGEPSGDAASPETTVTAGPETKTRKKSATFTFAGTDARSVASFECRLDAGSFEACTSPKSYSGLRKGSHTFSVRALDAAGNVDPTPATRTWTVKKKKKKKK